MYGMYQVFSHLLDSAAQFDIHNPRGNQLECLHGRIEGNLRRKVLETKYNNRLPFLKSRTKKF